MIPGQFARWAKRPCKQVSRGPIVPIKRPLISGLKHTTAEAWLLFINKVVPR